MNLETFSTERLILKKWTPADFIYLFQHYPVQEIRSRLGIQTDAEYAIEENKYKKGYTMHNKSFVFFQMIDKETRLIIGACGFHNWCAEHRRSELGYAIKTEPFKRKGLMTEALPFLLEYGFTVLGLNRIEAITRPGNWGSVKLLRNFQFREEGLLRQHVRQNDKAEDSLVFSLLREEYLTNPEPGTR